MKLQPYYCDMHIHTYPDANRRGSGYNCGALLTNVRRDAGGHRIVISLTDHNTINKEAYKELAELGADDVTPILGVELHVRSNGKRPYHAHAYFDSSVTDDAFIDSLNEKLDRLYPDKLPSKDDKSIPTLPQLLNEFRDSTFLFLPHGGQSHSTFDNALEKGELCDDLMMRSVYYNVFDGFTARSDTNLEKTESYFQKLGIDAFTNLLTGSDNYDPLRYPEPKADDAGSFSPTWVLASPTFDGLRLALSESSRLFYGIEPPDGFAMPTPSIEHVDMKNASIDIDVELSPGLNVVIGSSSSGKTLFLEALARKAGALEEGARNEFYDKFGIDSVSLVRSDATVPYYINQSYISKVVDKSVNRETIDSIRILKDVFPLDEDASQNLDVKFTLVRNLVSKLFSAAELVQTESEALRKLRSPAELITSGSLDSNPVTAMKPDKASHAALQWKSAAETKLDEALRDIEDAFAVNPLLDSIEDEVKALRVAVEDGKKITAFSEKVYSVLETSEKSFAEAEQLTKKSDLKRSEEFQSVLDHVSSLHDALVAFYEARDQLVAQRFNTVPREKELAGHVMKVSYAFDISEELLLHELNSLMKSDCRFNRMDDVTPDALLLSRMDGRRKITSMSAFGEAVSSGLEKSKKRIFSIKTRDGKDWNKLSEGRKTAVLLDLILSYRGNAAPLLIDQPEDNLASDYINGGLANAIRKSKDTRQTIIVTHNATIPMLADAQTVVLCKNEGGRIVIRSASLEGFIDGKRVLDWIADITDGGRPSIQKRFRKYDFGKFGE